ncbi:MAG: transcriptional repressor [Bacilli bacterium]|nr:transcriptional repressor [Bacilli bacterium]MDY6391578.1 Fur family transcriptional regulator [Bacilli bacterium]
MDEKEILRSHGLKATPCRVSVLRYVSSLDSPISADALYERIKGEGADLSTVYRTLNSLVEAGLLRKEVGPNKENIFSLLKDEVQHVLVCLRCGKRVPLEGCPYHEVNEQIEEKTGFRVLDHNTEIYGICPACDK